jgi:hypothetical protein
MYLGGLEQRSKGSKRDADQAEADQAASAAWSLGLEGQARGLLAPGARTGRRGPEHRRRRRGAARTGSKRARGRENPPPHKHAGARVSHDREHDRLV